MAQRCDYCGHSKSYHTPAGCSYSKNFYMRGEQEFCDCLEFTKIRNNIKHEEEE